MTKLLKRVITLLLITTSISVTTYAQNVNTYIPPRAFDYRDTLYNEISHLLPDIPDKNFVGSLIEHESCISLKHSKCWSATSALKNSREESYGFFQIARAFNPDGSARMDTLGSLKRKYKEDLNELSWGNIKQREDLQIRAGVLLIKDNWDALWQIPDPWERLAMTDNAYNGGIGWVNKERRQCGLQRGCDPDKWWGNVETTCLRSKKLIANYGNRSICDISRGHTKDVIQVRLPKYQDQYFNKDYLKEREGM